MTEREQEDNVEVQNGEKRMTIRNKISFSFCGPPYQLTSTAIGFFYLVFLLEVARLSPVLVSIIVLTGRFWDAITDPIVGHLVNVTQNRAPSLKKWCMCNTPVLGISYMLLWIVPPVPLMMKFGYYLVIYMVFQTSLTCLNVPSNVMIMYITKNPQDRNSATALKMTVELFSIVVSVLVQNLTILFLSKSEGDDCGKAIEMALNISSTGPPEYISSEVLNSWKTSYLVAASIITALIIVGLTIFVLGNDETINYQSSETRRRRAPSLSGSAPDEIKESFRSAFWLIINYKPFQMLTAAYLFLALSLQMIQTNFVLYLKIVFGLKDVYYYPLIALLMSAFLTVPGWQFSLCYLSKRRAFAVGNAFLMVPIVAMFFLASNTPLWQACLWCMFAGIGVANAYLLPWSMLPDVIADYHHTRGARHDGLFYGVFVFFTKFAVGVAQGISQLGLYVAGYDNGACEQNEDVSLTLRWLIAPVPCCFTIVSLFLLFFYRLEAWNEKNSESEDVQNLQETMADQNQIYQAKEANEEKFQESSSEDSLPKSNNSSLKGEVTLVAYKPKKESPPRTRREDSSVIGTVESYGDTKHVKQDAVELSHA